MSEADLRQQRRAAALRENLKRRKAQARAQAVAPAPPATDQLTPAEPPTAPAPAGDGPEK
jgi:hypothetical protein